MKVLLVEDEPLLGMSLLDEILRAGHEVLGPVPSTGAALMLARAEKPALALVDLDLRITLDVAQLVHSLNVMNVLTIVMSYDAERIASLARCIVAGLLKPFLIDDITAAIVATQATSDSNGNSVPLPSSITLFQRNL